MNELNFFTLSEDQKTLTYQRVDELIQSRTTIVDKFHDRFIGEKSYETISRYLGLIISEYCEFLQEAVVKKEDVVLEATLEELADIVLYHASMANELTKNLDTVLIEGRTWEADVDEIPLESLSLESAFTTLMFVIYRNFDVSFPDRKYHRGEQEEVDPETDKTRSSEFIMGTESLLVANVLNNLRIISAHLDIELETLVETFNRILLQKIDKVDQRLVDEYGEEIEEGVFTESTNGSSAAVDIILASNPLSSEEIIDGQIIHTEWIVTVAQGDISSVSFHDYIKSWTDLGDEVNRATLISNFRQVGPDSYEIRWLESRW